MSGIELHRKLIADPIRNSAFHEALKKSIDPGTTTIADIGSGTGFLSFLALQLGAKHVDLYEYTEALELSKRIAQKNKIKNCSFHHAHTLKVKKPARVDIVISETLGSFALEENTLETLADARRFLKPGGQIIPGRLEQWVAPVSSERHYHEINVWDRVGYGIDFSAARSMSLNNMYMKHIRGDEFWSLSTKARKWDDINFNSDKHLDSVRKADVNWEVTEAVTLFGFGSWWVSELVPEVFISTHPEKPLTHWEQVFLPFVEPLVCKKGDTLKLHIRSDSRLVVGIHVKWRASLYRDGKLLRDLNQDMKKGMI